MAVTLSLIRHSDIDLRDIVFRNLNFGKLILDQYHQFKATKPVEAEIVTKARFICNTFGINANVLSNERTYSIGIKIHQWGTSHRRFLPIVLNLYDAEGAAKFWRRVIIATLANFF